MKRGEVGRVNAYHIFCGEQVQESAMSGVSSQEALAHAAEKWSGTSLEEKRRLHVTALSRNVVTKRLKEDALLRLLDDMATAQSPWNVSKGSDKYPLHADDVQSMLDTTEGTKRMADEWKSESSMCFPDPSFPSEVAYNKSCLCSSLECLVKVEKDIIAQKDELVDQLSVILAPKGVKADFMKPLLITDAAGKQLLVQCTGLLKTSPMLSEFVVFNDNAGQEIKVPCCFSLAANRSCGGGTVHIARGLRNNLVSAPGKDDRGSLVLPVSDYHQSRDAWRSFLFTNW